VSKKDGTFCPRSPFTLRVLRLLSAAKLPTAPFAKSDAPRPKPRYVRAVEMAARDDSMQDQIVAHADALYGLARRLTARSDDAEDLVQETLIRALRASPELAEGSHLKAWLFRILRNAFYDLHRGRKHHRDVESLEDDEMTAEPNWLRGDAELDRLRGVVAREIEAALAKLSDDSKTVILLDLEGFTEAEIADIMDCPVGTVKSRLMRARMSLRKLLSQYAK
jgi:RNA polymerase sigma-70 factor (ECF subfamily)